MRDVVFLYESVYVQSSFIDLHRHKKSVSLIVDINIITAPTILPPKVLFCN